MGKMNPQARTAFIEDHLYYELRCLLGAATVWRVFQKTSSGFDVVLAMESAFVHARCLFEFFTNPKSGNDLSITEFVSKEYVSALYDTWCEALNRHVMHISKGRNNPTNVVNGKHLNEQVEVFAREILDLWKKFEQDPLAKHYALALLASRKRAIEDAKNDTAGRINPVFDL